MVTLVKRKGKAISIGSDRFCFDIENGEVVHNDASRVGCQQKDSDEGGNQNETSYNEAFELAQFAWENSMFDNMENHN
jgi:hypothetical protein